ncbi:MAG TPA: M13 family metallopeptidase N-terminal domain-containing protein, partial [Xanthobacteraceae bacterium]|nr:M13 family metallopeptidase N-terminal domain-containing protein [Xanthobacteraceae bacterium]
MQIKRVAAALAFGLSVLAAGVSAQESAPQYGKWGFDLAGADKATQPGDDFFRYANGTWLDKTAIPADKPGYSLRLAMTDLTEQRLRDIMQAAAATSGREPASLEGKVGAFYKSFMDEAHIDALGAKAIARELDAVRGAKSRDDLAALMGRTSIDFEGTLFGFGTDVDLKDPKRYAVYLGQGGLGLPDRDYYLKSDFAKQRAAYEAYATKLLTLLAWKNPGKAAKEVVAFETKVAEASWTKAQQRDINAIYNPMTIAELGAFAPGFAWPAFLKQAQLGEVKRVIVAEKSAVPKLAAIYAHTPVETLKAWQAVHLADNAAYYLSAPFADAYFDMHNKTLSGQQAQTARWKRGVHAVSGGDYLTSDRVDTFGNLGWAVGQLYTAKYFPPQSKAKIEELVANL